MLCQNLHGKTTAQRLALPAAGENQLTKRNQIPRLNQAQNAEPTTRRVHALLGGKECKAQNLKTKTTAYWSAGMYGINPFSYAIT